MKLLLTKIEGLRTSESIKDSVKILGSCCGNQDALDQLANLNFKLLNVILDNTVPRFYRPRPSNELEKSLKELVKSLFTNLTGLNMLLGLQNPSTIDILSSILSDEKLLLATLLEKANHSPAQLRLAVRSLDKLFFQATIFLGLQESGVELPPLLSDFKVYTKWLTDQYLSILGLKVDLSKITFTFLRVSNSNTELFLKHLLVDQFGSAAMKHFISHYKKLTKVSKYQFIKTFLFARFLVPIFTKVEVSLKTYTSLVYVVNYYLELFQLYSSNLETLVLDLLKSGVRKPALTVFLHSIVLDIRANSATDGVFFSHFKSWIERYWASELFIKNSGVEVQEGLTVFLIALMNHVKDCPQSNEFLRSLISEPSVIESTTLHLDQPMVKVRFMGMVFMERLSKYSGSEKPLKFDISSEKEYENKLLSIADGFSLDKACSFYPEKTFFNSSEYAAKALKDLVFAKEPSKESGTEILEQMNPGSNVRLVNKMTNLSLERYVTDSDDEKSDSDDEVYDDATLSRQNNTVPAVPIFLKDLHAYIISESKEDPHLAFLRKRIALENFSKIVRSNQSLIEDLRVWEEELCSGVLNTKTDELISTGSKSSISIEGIEQEIEQDTAEESQEREVNQLKLLALVSLIVVDPGRMPAFLIRKLISGDFNIMERLLIINSIGLAARELRGYQDDVNESNLKIEANLRFKKLVNGKVFPGKQLPQDLHDRFLVGDENFTPERKLDPLIEAESRRMDSIKHGIEREINENNKELIKNAVLTSEQGNVVRISSKLLKDREQRRANSGLVQKDKYSENCYGQFIAPFMTIWTTLDGDVQSLGTYSNVVITAILKTLNVLVYCSYPKSPDTAQIVREVFAVVESLKHTVSFAIQSSSLSMAEIGEIFECQLYLLLTVLQITGRGLLISQFESQVTGCYSWLNYYFEKFQDLFGVSEEFRNIQSLIANCLLQIREIMGG